MGRIVVYFFRWMALGIVICVLPLASAQRGDSSRIFRLGVFDRSSFEFAKGVPRQLVHIVASQNNPTLNWYATQPAETAAGGTAVGDASVATAPRAIEFTIETAPAAAYRMHIALLIESTGVPALRVTINGKHGMFYLHPALDFNLGDQDDPADYSHADILFTFPGKFLHQGSNTITFQAIEDTATPGATLTYDAIELDRDSKHFDRRTSSAEIDPTIFYSAHLGRLEELVDVFIRCSQSTADNDYVDLQIAGKHYREGFSERQDFGEEKVKFKIPEFPTQTVAKLAWTVNGRRQAREQSIDPAKKWTILLVPHIHLDIGYSDYQAKVAAIQSRAIDSAMDFTAHHPTFSFSLDGEWSLDQFLKSHTVADQQRAIAAIQNRQLFIPAQYACLLTGFSTAETLIRSLYPSANFSRIHKLPFDYANITDVPSYSWSYASILASAGIKDFLAGMNGRNVRAPVLMWGHLNEASPMWWEGPDGQKVLFWYSRGYQQGRVLFGLPPVVSSGSQTLPLFLQQYEHPNYRADSVIVYGTQQENTDLFPQQAELADKWNSLYAYPRLQYAGFHDALDSIAKQFGSDIPTIRGDGGPFWEDGIASDAYYAAMERINESRSLSAEKLQTLMTLINPRLAADKQDLTRMWTDTVLMDEHTWDSGNSVRDPTSLEAHRQLAVKNLYAINAHALADRLARNSMANMVDSISVGKGNLVVFNTLNWARSGAVVFDLSQGEDVVDSSTGQVIPIEVLNKGVRFRRVRFIASDVPATGYKVFFLRREMKPMMPSPIVRTTILESPYYRLELDPKTGAVKSIYDKQLKRELVNQESSYRFGQYLYVTGGDRAPNSLLNYVSAYPKPELIIHPARNGQLLSVTKTPYGCVARMESTDTNTPKIATEIRLFDKEKKIEFVEDVMKKKVLTKEGVYFAFPFAMSHPQFQYEIQNGVVNPATDMYPGAGREWFSVQHWISVQQDGVSAAVMPLDASLVTLGDINRGVWPKAFGDRPGTIFSYAMNNYWDTNWPAGQGGHFRFRYVITSASSTNAPRLSHLGWEEMTPLEEDLVTSQDKAIDSPRPLNHDEDSFIEVKDPDLLLETWKPAENGDGTILRFIDLGGTARTVTVHIPLLQIKEAWRTDAVERNKERLSLDGTNGFQFSIIPHGIITVRIMGKDVSAALAR